MQLLTDSFVLLLAAFIAVSVVREWDEKCVRNLVRVALPCFGVIAALLRAWGAEKCVRNLVRVALSCFGVIAVLLLLRQDQIADWTAQVAYYLLCFAVVAFIIQAIRRRQS
jgi:hypothetical protein